MTKAPKFKVGDRILLEHVVTGVLDNGIVTYEVIGTPTRGTPIAIKATVRLEEKAIRKPSKEIRQKRSHLRSATNPRAKLTRLSPE